MRSTRIAIPAAMLGALTLPALSTTPASAATVPTAIPGVSCHNLPPLPYAVHAKAVTIRSKASSKSTALGVLYKSPQVQRGQEERHLALHHGQDDRRQGLGLRHVRLPRRPHVPGLTGIRHAPLSGGAPSTAAPHIPQAPAFPE